MATEPTTPTTNRCCELCRAVGHQGKIDTPWCGKMGNCPCHTNRCCELCLGDENTECRFKAGNPPPFCPCHTNRCCADCEEVGKFRGEWYCTNPFCKCHSQKGERIEMLARLEPNDRLNIAVIAVKINEIIRHLNSRHLNK